MAPKTGRQRLPRRDKLVEEANAVQPTRFFEQYMPDRSGFEIVKQQLPDLANLHFRLGDADALEGSILTQCLDLIEETSSEAYRNSDVRWSRTKKHKEMTLPDMRYVVLTVNAGSVSERVVGFTSFMITYEDGHDVIYCYEVHLAPQLRSKGVGSLLMRIVEQIGRKVAVEKSMLTVFKSNTNALKMYAHLGYVEDQFSPQPRKLRNGTVKDHSYSILSKQLSRGP